MRRLGFQCNCRLVIAALVATSMGCGSKSDSAASHRPAPTAPGRVVAAPIERRAGEHVDVALQLAQGQVSSDETVEVRLTLRVAPLWEIAALTTGSASAATRIDIELPPELATATEWDLPETVPSVGPDPHPAYLGEVVFRRRLRIREGTRPGTYEVGCRVSYQVCNERQCLQPEAVVLSVPLRVD